MEPVPTTQAYEAFKALFPDHCPKCYGVGYHLQGNCEECIGQIKCPTCMKPLPETRGECCGEKYDSLFAGSMSRPPRYTRHLEYGPMIALLMITDAFRKALESVVASNDDVMISCMMTPSVTWPDGGSMERPFFAGNLHKTMIDTMVFIERRFIHHIGHARPDEIATECSLMIDKAITFISRMYSLGSQVMTPDAMITENSIEANAEGIKGAIIKRMDEYAQNPLAKPVAILVPGGGTQSLGGAIRG